MSDLPTGPLVETEWLAAHLDDPRVRIVDMRGKVLPPTEPKPHYFARHDDYAASHLPGAVYIDWTRDIVDLDDPILVQVAPPEQIAELFGRLGIGNEHFVVAYDDAFSMFAGRLLWVLRYYGHTKVAVLNGGLVKWQAEGRPLTSEVPSHPATIFTPREQPELKRNAEDVAARLGDQQQVLLDARSPKEFAGEESRAVRGGHIPGAFNLFFRDLVTGPNQTFADPAELRARFAQAGLDLAALDSESDVIAYCNGGVSATPVSIAFELLTGKPAKLYDGSWNDWGNDENRPIER